MKTKYYSQYEPDDERLTNRPNDIPLEDLKMVVKYRGDESVKVACYLISHDLKVYENWIVR